MTPGSVALEYTISVRRGQGDRLVYTIRFMAQLRSPPAWTHRPNLELPYPAHLCPRPRTITTPRRGLLSRVILTMRPRILERWVKTNRIP